MEKRPTKEEAKRSESFGSGSLEFECTCLAPSKVLNDEATTSEDENQYSVYDSDDKGQSEEPSE